MAMETDRPGEPWAKSLSSDDGSLVDYEELYDELFSRSEQSVGAQIHPVSEVSGGDS